MRRVGLVVAVGALLVALSAAAALATTRFGTDAADWLYGYAGADAIYGYAGADTIYGYAGADAIYTGTGSDSVYGGSGDDFVSFVGGDSPDYIDCGPGFDTVEKWPATGPTNLHATNCEEVVY
jgi:Ca2+-binding RTX toxin-like protein